MHDNDTPDQPYLALSNVLAEAWNRSALGKGRERHANGGERFEDQTSVRAVLMFGEHCWDGQVAKKMLEADRLDGPAGDRELLDVIVYTAARVVARRLARAGRRA